MNNKFLTPEELIKLTGFRQKSRQIAHLKSLGVPFSVDGTGYAVVLWSALENSIQQKTEQIASPVTGYTFAMLVDRYKREVLPGKAARTQADNLRELDKLSEYFGVRFAVIDEIKPLDVRQFMNWRVKGGKGQVRANRDKALLSHMWNKAREWGYTNLPNPCAGIKGYREKGRDVYVENDTYYKVWDKADEPTRDAMDLAYLTGQRPADVLKLNEFDFDDELLYVNQNKTGKKLRIQVTGELKKVLGRVIARKKQTGSISRALIVNENGLRMTYEAITGTVCQSERSRWY